MVDRSRRDSIVDAWKAAGEPWSGLAGSSEGVPWGFALLLEEFGMLDEFVNFRPDQDGNVIVGIQGHSLVVATSPDVDMSHNTELSFVPLSEVTVTIHHRTARRSPEAGQWGGSVRLSHDEITYEVPLREPTDLKWARTVYEATTGVLEP